MPDVQHSSFTGTNLHEDKRIKAPARVASTANVSLATPGATIDGVSMSAGDRVLLKNQTTASQNGIYVWNGASTALTRSTDAAANADFGYGFLVYVREGTANGAKTFQFTTSSSVTLGSTSLSFASIAGSASGTVTSVALTMPGDFTVSGSPVTASGTLAVTATTQSANTIKAGPTTGAAAAPTYRTMVSADLPSAPTVSGEVTASDFKASGLTGATAASRYVGATASGAPASGTFVVGDLVVDQSGKLWICTVAGSPGTWTQVAGSGGGGGGGTNSGTGARVRNSANQSATSGSALTLQWDTEDVDSDSQHFTSSANLTGTVSKTAASTTLTGSSTVFTTELSVGQVISVPGTAAEVAVVTAIASNTSLTVAVAFANTASGQTATRVNSAIVARQAGFYVNEIGIYSAALASGTGIVQLRLNGSTIVGQADRAATNASAGYGLSVSRSLNQWDYLEVLWTQSSGGSVNVLADERTHWSISMGTAVPYVLIQDQKTSGTHGGASTSGSFQTRTLNTVVSDASSLATLASNQVTLQAGTYRVSASAPCYSGNNHQIRLQDVTASSTLATGTSEYAGNFNPGTQTRSFLVGRFTVAANHLLEVQHRVATSITTDGLGVATSFGTEVYTTIEFWREG